MAAGKKRQFFGTDGVRDIANSGMMTPAAALNLGAAYTIFLKAHRHNVPTIAIGRDTRKSGDMLSAALAAGIASFGGNAVDIGVIPTPGVSFTLAGNNFDGGAVVSASHNPAEYNGIKYLDGNGFKLTDEDEIEIEEIFLDLENRANALPEKIGSVTDGGRYRVEYAEHLKEIIAELKDYNCPIVVDAANGAASAYVEPLFANWGGHVTFIANRPDGININNGVGVTHIDTLSKEVLAQKAELGIAYDGDTDRVLLCDKFGRTLDGDIMLWIIGRWLNKHDKLGAGVTATVMSNMALVDALAKDGIKVFRCGVGDRYVLETMKKENSLLGGEQSGHIIALDHANTGDGLCAGILFLRAAAELNEDISTLSERFEPYPQVLRNIRVKDKNVTMEAECVKEATEEAKKLLGDTGRMLLRPSGTEPLIRIFVESRNKELMNHAADIMECAIKSTLN